MLKELFAIPELKTILTIAFGCILTQNVILVQTLGICPFLGVSKKRSSAFGMGCAIIVVILFSTTITWFLYNFILKNPALISLGEKVFGDKTVLDFSYLQILVFILVIASLVQMLEMFLKKCIPSLYKALGIYLPLITTNCAVLGLANSSIDLTFIEMIVTALFSGVGYLFVMIIFSSIREKMKHAPIPAAFKGVPTALITAAGLAMIFARLGGII